jgi:tetraacyldisaccharide 4'-kinase
VIGPLARLRRSLYARGIVAARSLPRSVVSVGNLSVGGAGKTPHVQFLARWAAGEGLSAAVLSRGYGRRSRGVVWVSDGRGPRVPVDEAGDEPYLLASTLPGVPVLVGESRYEAGMACLSARDVDLFILDDGFQHLTLRRDADLLLVDADRGLGNRMTLPFGPLREPPACAGAADALVVTKCRNLEKGKEVAASIPFPADRPRAFTRLVPEGLVDREGGSGPLPADRGGGRVPAAAFCGLARNGQFRETLAEAGFDVETFVPFGDHHRYSAQDVARIAKAAGGLTVVTTEKDLARFPEGAPFPVKALRVGVEFLGGWEALSRLILSRIGKGGAS